MRCLWAFLARLAAGSGVAVLLGASLLGCGGEGPSKPAPWVRVAAPTELKVQNRVVGRVPQGTILQV